MPEMPQPRPPFVENLLKLLELRGTTARQLATDIGVHPSLIYDIINGKVRNPRQDTMTKIADGLGVQLAELVGDIGNNESAMPSSRLSKFEADLVTFLRQHSAGIPLSKCQVEMLNLFDSLDTSNQNYSITMLKALVDKQRHDAKAC